MKYKNTAAGPFSALFRNSFIKTCFVPIITFLALFMSTLVNYIGMEAFHTFQNSQFDKNRFFGFFWNDVGDSAVFAEVLIILGGVLAGTILFSFAQSKKQCNVIFSLGISRRKIFLAKYLGGLFPFCAAVIIAAFFELVAVFGVGYSPNAAIIKIAVYWVVSFIGIYSISFTITSAAIAYTGNIVEGLIFTVIIAMLPMAAGVLFGEMRGFYTVGGIGVYEGEWNFFSPYLYMFKFISLDAYGAQEQYSEGSYMLLSRYLIYFTFNENGAPFYNLTISDYSGAITDFVYAAIIFVIAFLAFPKRRNEISGSFGRAKGINEICAALAGIYVMVFGMHSIIRSMFDTERGSFLAFLYSLGFFIVPYFVFKMIFAHKRKLIIKSTLKRIPCYIVSIAIVTTVFSTGLFGYASRIPNAEDIDSIEFSSTISNPYSTVNNSNALHRNPIYGYEAMTAYMGYSSTGGYDRFFDGSGYQNIYYPTYSVDDESMIHRLIEIHRSFVQKGHIKSTASDTCAMNFQIVYTLKNGKTIKRYYSVTTEENAKRIMGLCDTTVAKSGIENFFESKSDYYYTSDDFLSEIPNELNTEYYFYLYSKYLKDNYRCGLITDELKKAVLKDLENQTANDIFFHNPEDELGVISFGIGNNFVDDLPDNYYCNEYGDIIDRYTGEIVKDKTLQTEQAQASMKLTDLTSNAMGTEPKSFVITKTMTNTIKYLTDNGYMKYLEPKITASDVKSMKLCTKSESVGKTNADMLPIFTGGYNSVADIKKFDSETDYYYGNSPELSSHYIKKNVPNEITNKSTIQKVLDNSFLYGYCGNDYRIAEITFNDGSIATYCITGEVYEKLMK